MPTTARKLAATLSEKKAELAAIDNVSLPRLHQAIGRRLARLANVPPSLAIHAERIRDLESSETQTELSSGDTLGSAYATCGREAVAQYGAKAVPKEIAAEFEAVTKAREALVAEIAALESTTGSRAVTALRLVAAALVLVAMLGGFVFMRNGSALLGARTDGGAASDSGGSVTAPTGLANGSAGSSSPRSLANDDIADIQGIADRVTKTVAEQIKGLAKKEPASAIQKGCDAALREWRSSAAQLLAPIANTAAVKGLPAGLKAGVFKEALATLDEDYQREVTQATDELARRVESTKEDVGGQFTFLLDNGKPFVVPADKRIPALEQICNRLADYFTDTTNRLARARTDGVQTIAAAWEQAQSALASMANDLEAESQSAKQRLTRESKSLIDSVTATSSRVDGAATKAIETRLVAFKKEITAAMDAEVKAYDEYWAKRARDFSSLVQGGGDADALSEQQHEITTSLYSRVEGSLKVIREKCDAERQSLAALASQAKVSIAAAAVVGGQERLENIGTGSPKPDQPNASTPSLQPYDETPDPAVLAALGKGSLHYDEFGFMGIELGLTYDEVDRQKPLSGAEVDQPFVFFSKSGHDLFIFDTGDRLRLYIKEYSGGEEHHTARVRDKFGEPEREPIIRVYKSRQSRTDSKIYVYRFPKTLVLVDFLTVQRVNLGKIVTSESMNVCVIDQQWALSVLSQTAAAKRPLFEWIKDAADITAAGTCNVAGLPAVPGTRVVTDNEDAYQRVVVVDSPLLESGRESEGYRPQSKQAVASMVCISTEMLAEGPVLPRIPRVEAYCDNYTMCRGTYGLKQEQAADSPKRRGVNALYAPYLRLLNDEVTSALLQEYCPPTSDTIRYSTREQSGVTEGDGYYEWQTRNEAGASFKVICGTDGQSEVCYLHNLKR